MIKSFQILLVSLLVWVTSTTAWAQEVPANLSRDEAAILKSRVEEKLEEGDLKELTQPTIERDLKEKPKKSQAQTKFTVDRIEITGNQMLTLADLEPVVKPFENRELVLGDLDVLAGLIEDVYSERGFITTYVYLPEQRIEDGVVTLNVVEGKIDKIIIDGNRYFKDKTILSYANIKEGDVLRHDELQSVLRSLNRNPDREAQAILKKGDDPETTSLIFKINDRLPFHVGLFFDNRGNRASGKERVGLTVSHNNLTGRDDVATAAFVLGRDFGVLFSRYYLPIPAWESGLIAHVSVAQSVPKRELIDFGVNSLSQTYGLAFEHIVYDSDTLHIDGEIGIDFKDSETRVLGEKFRRDHLRVLRFSPEARLLHQGGSIWWKSDFAWGLDMLGASTEVVPSASRQGVQTSFFKYRGDIQHHRKVSHNTRMVFRSSFQLPARKLPSQEALFLGGASSVRGYPEGDYLADMGYQFTIEYYIPSFFLPRNYELPGAGQYLWKQIEWYAFYDRAYGRLRGASAREIAKRNPVGLGVGVRAQVYQDAYGRIELGFAVGDDPITEASRVRIHFGFDVEV